MLTIDQLEIDLDGFRLSVDVAFEAGKITALMGPSGSGKSTLLGAIAGFVMPQAGLISWDGQPISAQEPGKRPVSILFQDNNLFPHMTVGQNVKLGLGPGRQDADTIVNEALISVGLGGFSDRKPAQLSGGQQSRAAIARVMVSDRPVVLLDEPFAALGPGLKEDMLAMTRKKLARHGRAVIMVTHGPDDARQSADSVAWIEDNCVMAPQATAEIFKDPPEGMTSYLGATG